MLERSTRRAVDFGLPTKTVVELKELVEDLKVAIQVAIDDANAKPRKDDPALNDVISSIVALFQSELIAEKNK